jgi:1,4-dihydroxy-6-naphthoate synthase
MKLKIGISPCPNDTFIFDGIYNKLINLKGYEFEFILEDVQTLNELALKGDIDIIKIRYAHYFNVMKDYILLRCGSALGKGVGPLLIAKFEIPLSEINNQSIAIPGIYTTANFLFSYAFPDATNKSPLVFSEIENAVTNGTKDVGVIIHENRFTYQEKGNYWDEKTQLPIPLGGIAIKRNLAISIQQDINNILHESLLLSRKNYPVLGEFITCHAQEMSQDVMKQHIDLYVNDYSLDIGRDGQLAVEKMQSTLGNQSTLPLFIEK